MLVDLTVNKQKAQEKSKIIKDFFKKQYNREPTYDEEVFYNEAHKDNYIKTGMYWNQMYDGRFDLFDNKVINSYDMNDGLTMKQIFNGDHITTFGTARTIEEIEEFYEFEIADRKNKYVIVSLLLLANQINLIKGLDGTRLESM